MSAGYTKRSDGIADQDRIELDVDIRERKFIFSILPTLPYAGNAGMSVEHVKAGILADVKRILDLPPNVETLRVGIGARKQEPVQEPAPKQE